MNSITKRWVRGSLLFTIAVLLAAEVLFLYFTVTSYRKSARDEIIKHLNTLYGWLSISSTYSQQTREVQLRRVVEQFDAKTQFEFMMVDYNGEIVSSSSGIVPEQQTIAPDIEQILMPGAPEQTQYIGKNENGEEVMAITVRTPYSADGIVAMSMVTSLELVNDSIGWLVLASVGFLLVVVTASVVSGVYFIRSIVLPLQKVEATASRIAQGDFDTRIENKHNDEIGSLCKTINHMAEALSQSEQMKNEFISSVSHELRTPLTSIKGWTETISHIANPADASFRRGVNIIAGETDRLYDMVEELLDFSRIQNGLTLQKEMLDLAAEVEEAVLIAEQRAASLGVSLHYEAPELPVPVMADRNRLRQVFINVLDNAVKYSRAGGNIYIEISCGEALAEIDIADEGQGIAPEDLENVKVKFYKGKGAVRGSGIGLAVVDEIMRAHGGEMKIQSKVGQGTRVTLQLPLHSK
ncbi:MAG: sensor histidine kinase [Oscillospiraceae bacterium]